LGQGGAYPQGGMRVRRFDSMVYHMPQLTDNPAGQVDFMTGETKMQPQLLDEYTHN